MSKRGRLSLVVVIFGVAVGLIIFTVMDFLGSTPPSVNFTIGHKPGQPVDMTLQTVGALGFGTHPTWVSYMTKSPQGPWVHTTLWQLPSHTTVNVTLYEFDSGSPLRNQQIGLVTGTLGSVEYINGKATSLINSYAGNGVAHTFSIPTLGINVPLYGVDGNAKNFCNGPAPCPTSDAHNLIRFRFVTPGPGQYPWQCFVPCGLGYLYGNGGPMQTIGYMDGFLKVSA